MIGLWYLLRHPIATLAAFRPLIMFDRRVRELRVIVGRERADHLARSCRVISPVLSLELIDEVYRRACRGEVVDGQPLG